MPRYSEAFEQEWAAQVHQIPRGSALAQYILDADLLRVRVRACQQ